MTPPISAAPRSWRTAATRLSEKRESSPSLPPRERSLLTYFLPSFLSSSPGRGRSLLPLPFFSPFFPFPLFPLSSLRPHPPSFPLFLFFLLPFSRLRSGPVSGGEDGKTAGKEFVKRKKRGYSNFSFFCFLAFPLFRLFRDSSFRRKTEQRMNPSFSPSGGGRKNRGKIQKWENLKGRGRSRQAGEKRTGKKRERTGKERETEATCISLKFY